MNNRYTDPSRADLPAEGSSPAAPVHADAQAAQHVVPSPSQHCVFGTAQSADEREAEFLNIAVLGYN